MNKLTMVSQLFFLPSLMLSGIMFPADLLPAAFATIGKLFPATWGYVNLSQTSLANLTLYPFFLMIAATLIIILIKTKKPSTRDR